ncbi:unnamed protein product [marine sediment metagenome]|uniref:Uncharacterized protein n=1 Tax=marine sediment metagenome TaxID=412755 RepID=X0Z9A0_9ZZZZ
MADKTIRGPFGVEKGITTDNVGTVASGSSVVEYGDGVFHQTVITVDTTLPTIASGNHGYGKLVYTFPAGALDVKATYMSMALTQTDGNITLDTPDIGIGTVIATGSTSATLDAGTEEDIMGGQTADNCNGTAEVKHLATGLIIAATGGVDHTVHFNAAANWSGTDDACAIAGTIIIEWTFVV